MFVQSVVTVRRIPFGAQFVEGEGVVEVYGRRRVMERIGAMIDQAGEIEIRFRVDTAEKGANDETTNQPN